MAKTLEQQLAAAELKANALRSKLTKATRSADTRRKIVVGGMVLAAMDSDTGLRAAILELLHRKVTRPKDREAVADLLAANGAGAAPFSPGDNQHHRAAQ